MRHFIAFILAVCGLACLMACPGQAEAPQTEQVDAGVHKLGGTPILGATTLLFSPVNVAAGLAANSPGGSATLGHRFYVTSAKPVTLKGVRVYAQHSGGPFSIKVTLWDGSCSLIDSATNAAVVSGVVTEIDFSTVHSLSAATGFYEVAAWETSGTIELTSTGVTSGTNWPTNSLGWPWTVQGVVYAGPYFVAGNACPTNLDTGPEASEPVFQ